MQIENDVAKILDVLDIECLPSGIFGSDKLEPKRSRLVKVVLPSTVYKVALLRTRAFLVVARFFSCPCKERLRKGSMTTN